MRPVQKPAPKTRMSKTRSRDLLAEELMQATHALFPYQSALIGRQSRFRLPPVVPAVWNVLVLLCMHAFRIETRIPVNWTFR